MKSKSLIILLTIGTFLSVEAQEKKQTMNPFFQSYNTPFNVPAFDKIKNEHFKPAILEGIKKHEAEINLIANNPEAPTFDNTILAMENAGELLSEVNRVFGNYNSANTNDELQAIAKETAPDLSAPTNSARHNVFTKAPRRNCAKANR
jgi:peptidyl-dipeptidase Dcp